jgi:hypothetical protein
LQQRGVEEMNVYIFLLIAYFFLTGCTLLEVDRYCNEYVVLPHGGDSHIIFREGKIFCEGEPLFISGYSDSVEVNYNQYCNITQSNQKICIEGVK